MSPEHDTSDAQETARRYGNALGIIAAISFRIPYLDSDVAIQITGGVVRQEGERLSQNVNSQSTYQLQAVTDGLLDFLHRFQETPHGARNNHIAVLIDSFGLEGSALFNDQLIQKHGSVNQAKTSREQLYWRLAAFAAKEQQGKETWGNIMIALGSGLTS